MGQSVVAAYFVLRGSLCHERTGKRSEKFHVSELQTVSGH